MCSLLPMRLSLTSVSVEIGLIGSNDQTLSLSFGQARTVLLAIDEFVLTSPKILATFAAVPPVVATAELAPKFWRWLTNLTWVRAMTGKPRSVAAPVLPFEDEKEKKGLEVSHPVKYQSWDLGEEAYERPRASEDVRLAGHLNIIAM
jgi:hypothetical protein